MKSQVQFKKLDPKAKINQPCYSGDVGYDIFSVESKWIWPLFPKAVDTGLALGMDDGLYCTVETRSGHGVKKHLRCHRGIIDSGYRGRITIKVYNHGILPHKIKTGEKIAQMVFHPTTKPKLTEVKNLKKSDRNEKGFGSTG